MKLLIVAALVLAAEAAVQPMMPMNMASYKAMPMNMASYKAMPMNMAMPEARWGQSAPAHVMNREANAEVVEQVVDMTEPGRYMYRFKTNNGIGMMEQFAMDKDAAKVQGEFEWTSPEGETYKTTYLADEMGYRPVGAHIHPVPVAIQRSLEWNAAHPEEDMDGMHYSAKRMMN